MILKVEPKERPTIDQILQHPFILRCSQNRSGVTTTRIIDHQHKPWIVYGPSQIGTIGQSKVEERREGKVEVYKHFSSHPFSIHKNEQKPAGSEISYNKVQGYVTTTINPISCQLSSTIGEANHQNVGSKSTSNLHSSRVYRQLVPSNRQFTTSQPFHLQSQARPMSMDRKPITLLYQSRSMDSPPKTLTVSSPHRMPDNPKPASPMKETPRSQTSATYLQQSSSTPRLHLSVSHVGVPSRATAAPIQTGFIQSICSQAGVPNNQHRGYLNPQSSSQTPRAQMGHSGPPDRARVFADSNRPPPFFTTRPELDTRPR